MEKGYSDRDVQEKCIWQGIEEGEWEVIIALDGAWDKKTLNGGSAWVTRNCETDQEMGRGWVNGYMLSAIQVEALAWVEGLKWAIGKGFRRVRMIADSKELWEGVCMGKRLAVEAKGIVADGLRRSVSLVAGSIIKVPRSSIQEAHILAVNARKRVLPSVVY